MDQSTKDEPQSRVDRIKAAHSFLRENEIRLLLCHEYKLACQDPTTGGPSGIQIRLECAVDVITRLSEHEVKNKIAVVQEYITVPWEEAMEAISLLEDED